MVTERDWGVGLILDLNPFGHAQVFESECDFYGAIRAQMSDFALGALGLEPR